jgi:ribose 5-phosphate isomerase B
MRFYLGSDHAGFALKAHLTAWLTEARHDPVDCGAETYDAEDDYPPFVLRAAERAVQDPDGVAVVIGGSGNGEAIAANKVRGARAVLVWSEETARLGREHNHANVLSLGARTVTEEQATRFLEVFLVTPYSPEERHVRRLAEVADYETSGLLPSLPDAPPSSA